MKTRVLKEMHSNPNDSAWRILLKCVFTGRCAGVLWGLCDETVFLEKNALLLPRFFEVLGVGGVFAVAYAWLPLRFCLANGAKSRFYRETRSYLFDGNEFSQRYALLPLRSLSSMPRERVPQ